MTTPQTTFHLPPIRNDGTSTLVLTEAHGIPLCPPVVVEPGLVYHPAVTV